MRSASGLGSRSSEIVGSRACHVSEMVSLLNCPPMMSISSSASMSSLLYDGGWRTVKSSTELPGLPAGVLTGALNGLVGGEVLRADAHDASMTADSMPAVPMLCCNSFSVVTSCGSAKLKGLAGLDVGLGVVADVGVAGSGTAISMKLAPNRLLISPSEVVTEGLERLRGGVGLTARFSGAQASLTTEGRAGRLRRAAAEALEGNGRRLLPIRALLLANKVRATASASGVVGLMCSI